MTVGLLGFERKKDGGKRHFPNFKPSNVPRMIHCVFKWLVPGDPLLLIWIGCRSLLRRELQRAETKPNFLCTGDFLPRALPAETCSV